MPTQLSIRDIKILKIQYSLGTNALTDVDEKDSEKQTQVNFNFATEEPVTKDKQHLLKIIQSVDLGGEAFQLILEIGGMFALDSLPSGEELDKLKHINCNAILFPYLREAVSDISRKVGLNPIYLPPLNFVEMYRKGVFRDSKSQETGVAKSS